MKKNLLKISLLSILLLSIFFFKNLDSNFKIQKNSFEFGINKVHAQYTYGNGWDTTNGDCQGCTTQYHTCPDGWNVYTYSQSECPATQTTQSTQYHTCPDGWNVYTYSQSECPSVYSPNSYTPPVYTTTYPQPSYNYPVYTYPTSVYTQQQPTYVCWNGQYVYNQSQCPVQTQTCPNGQIINIYQVCPAQTQTCWNGAVIPVNQSCPSQYQTCPNGQVIPINQSCPTTTQTCWNGAVIPINQSCPSQTQTCPNGQIIPITQTCPSQTQTCWNGAVIPVSQTCPAQYQTCWNGAVIPVSQTCPVKNTTVVVPVVQIRDHAVVTNLATMVGMYSAQCNGVGFISGGLSSVGWFEYGTSVNLGNSTNSANIGSGEQESFSNLITGLKSNTTYYCRAVMANTDGTYKGKIVSFKTLGKKVIYASPRQISSVKPKTKTQFVCSDGSLAVAKTVAVGETINAGGKLLNINIERSSPTLVQGSLVNYRITVTNTADTAVSGVEVKIVLPTEMSFVDATTTNGVTIQDAIMTIPVGDINAKDVKTFIVPAKVVDSAEIGKTVVTTVYVSYNLPINGSEIVKDEASSYMVANIVGADGSTGLSDKNTSSKSLASMLFPQTLLGWLVLFAIILIIVVLVMNIHKWIIERRKEKEEYSIHHHTA